MRHIKTFIVFGFLLIILAACGATGNNDVEIKPLDEENNDDSLQTTLEERNVNEDVDKKEQADELTTEEDQQSFMEEKLAESYFTEVELEVEYANGVEYELEIDWDDGFIKAKIDDEINNQKIAGIDAFIYIYERMDELGLTPTSQIDVVAEQIISSFDLPIDYEEIEIEVKFHNGSELELKDKVH